MTRSVARKIGRYVVLAAAAILLVALIGLEAWYWILLPSRLPQKSSLGLPAPVRQALWIECGGRGEAHSRALVPFLAAWFVPDGHSAANNLFYRVAEQHIQSLEQEGVLTRERHIQHILRSIAVATWLSRHWTAAEALDAYASRVWVGGNRYGLSPGAIHEFGRPLERLSTPDLAVLVAVIRSPRIFDPACYPDRTLEARNTFLRRMAEAGALGERELQSALAAPLGVSARCEAPRKGG